jgi:hypothetical protein
MQTLIRAVSRAECRLGRSIDAKIAMIAITTSSSIRVKGRLHEQDLSASGAERPPEMRVRVVM